MPNNLDNCPNCTFPFPMKAKYCSQCGQKRTDGRLTFGEMMNEFSDAIFNFDSKIFKTIFALFIPGKLTNEYFKGRHRRYIHPLRIFLVLTVGVIAAATYQLDNPDFIGIGDEMNRKRQKHNKMLYMVDTDSLIRLTAEENSHPKAIEALDSLSQKLFKGKKITKEDSIDLSKNFNIMGDNNLKIAFDDFDNLSPDSIVNLYNIQGGTTKRFLTKQQIRLSQRGENFGFYLIGNVSWMVFFMMPVFGLVLKLLYLRKNYYYVEHLIFSFHTHCFAFLLYIIMILFGHYAPGWIIGGGFVVLAIYLFNALKAVYKQSNFITMIKYIIMSVLYIFVLSFAVFVTSVASFALF
ncbi:DUF3667 domain-containing protein [Saprospiraceae bacterium]|jgi:hypothetical protein|nr:DUF3667 domain-containing protein [Bacteroidota bacterium]MDB4728217.1 DUF3667 domain-containing protein [Saprospiraceae bacterium]MDF1864755.1 DUF3667 domain-containing protein [Saprospiraceae bacterium]